MGRRGPKPKPGMKRMKNNRIKRGKAYTAERKAMEDKETTAEAMQTALEARWRVHGVSRTDARNPMAGSVVGRMVLHKDLSSQQHDAAITFLKDRKEYLRYIEPPKQPGAVDLNAVHGRPVTADADYEAKATNVIAKYKSAEAAILEANMHLRGSTLWAAVDYLLFRDEYHDSLAGDFRQACNALVRHYKLHARDAA